MKSYYPHRQSRLSLYAEYARCVGPPKHQGPPCSQRCFNFSFILSGQLLWKHEWSFFLGTKSALHRRRRGSPQPPPNVQHPPGWCDSSHCAPELPPHTSLLVERRQCDEANQCMGVIRRPWWSEANERIWPEWIYTPTLFRRTSCDF